MPLNVNTAILDLRYRASVSAIYRYCDAYGILVLPDTNKIVIKLLKALENSVGGKYVIKACCFKKGSKGVYSVPGVPFGHTVI